MRITILCFVLLGSLASAGGAWAHARLDRASPAVGSTVKPPSEIVLTFTQGVEAAFSRIEVRNAKGERVDAGKAKLGGNRNELRVSVKPLAAGRYSVSWSVLSVDTHKSQGNFSFDVAP